MIDRLSNEKIPSAAPRASSAEVLAQEIIERLTYRIGKDPKVAKPHDWLTAAILVVRDRITDNWMESTRKTYATDAKRVYYLSLEFLIGRLMRDAVTNIGLMDELREALASFGVDLDVIAALEPDAALGNGGLGRLAACFMESMATVDIPAYGYGIRYVHGLFRQQMADGWQVELPETWLAHGNPWEFERRETPTKSASAARSKPSMSMRKSPATSGNRPSVLSPRPAIRRSSAGAPSASTRCACGQPIRSTRSCWMPSMPVITSARSEKATRPKALPASSTRQTQPQPVRNCACARNSSSRPPRCRTSCAAICSNIRISPRCRTRWRSS